MNGCLVLFLVDRLSPIRFLESLGAPVLTPTVGDKLQGLTMKLKHTEEGRAEMALHCSPCTKI